MNCESFKSFCMDFTDSDGSNEKFMNDFFLLFFTFVSILFVLRRKEMRASESHTCNNIRNGI